MYNKALVFTFKRDKRSFPEFQRHPPCHHRSIIQALQCPVVAEKLTMITSDHPPRKYNSAILAAPSISKWVAPTSAFSRFTYSMVPFSRLYFCRPPLEANRLPTTQYDTSRVKQYLHFSSSVISLGYNCLFLVIAITQQDPITDQAL